MPTAAVGIGAARSTRLSAGNLEGVCAQCLAGAAVAASGATGVRAYVAAKRPAWMTPRRLRWTSGGLVAAAVVLASVGL